MFLLLNWVLNDPGVFYNIFVPLLILLSYYKFIRKQKYYKDGPILKNRYIKTEYILMKPLSKKTNLHIYLYMLYINIK